MRYITTNIRMPENLWKALKTEAARQGKRMAQVLREHLWFSLSATKRKSLHKKGSLLGVWKDVPMIDKDIEEAKASVFSRQPLFK